MKKGNPFELPFLRFGDGFDKLIIFNIQIWMHAVHPYTKQLSIINSQFSIFTLPS